MNTEKKIRTGCKVLVRVIGSREPEIVKVTYETVDGKRLDILTENGERYSVATADVIEIID